MDHEVGANYNSENSSPNEGRLVGFYTQKERRNKISHYRHKQKKRREKCPISKNYSGRKRSAFQKPRKDGRFVKNELAHLYSLTDEDRMKRTRIIDEKLGKGNYEGAVSLLIEY